MSVQTSYDKNPAVGLEGQIADTHQVRDQVSRLVNEANGIPPGLPVVRSGASEDEVQLPPAPHGVDADAFITSTASPTSETTFDGAQLDGVLDGDEQPYGFLVDLILDSSTDWDATTATLKAKRASDGAIVEESLDIPDGGNATVTTSVRYSQVISLTIPAQTGTGGSFTLGTNAADPSFSRATAQGVGVLRTAREESAYVDDEMMPVLRKGRIFVKTEVAVVDGEKAFARHTAPGTETVGAFRNDDDGGNAAEYFGTFRSEAAADGIAVLEVDVPGAPA